MQEKILKKFQNPITSKIDFGEEKEHIPLTINESKKIQIHNIPITNAIIKIFESETNRVIQSYGRIKIINDKYSNIQLEYLYFTRSWNHIISLEHFIDFHKRLLNRESKITDIRTKKRGFLIILTCKLKYIHKKNDFLYSTYQYGKQIDNQISLILNNIQSSLNTKMNELKKDHITFLKTDMSLSILEITKLIENETDSNKKGQYLEDLLVKLLNNISGFEIVNRFRTINEEVDILVKNKSTNPFLVKESQIILVECKNWNTSKPGKNDYIIFKEKIKNRFGRSKLGLFISWNGFTKTFIQESLKNSKDDILIVPITGSEIKESFPIVNFEKALEDWIIRAQSNKTST